MLRRLHPLAPFALALFSSCLAPVGGCGGTESRLNPEEPLDSLPSAGITQLCRYTVDVLAGQDVACLDEAAALGSVDACEGAPPWAGFETVRDWEDCVNARLESPCLVEAPCAP